MTSEITASPPSSYLAADADHWEKDCVGVGGRGSSSTVGRCSYEAYPPFCFQDPAAPRPPYRLQPERKDPMVRFV
eukprot:92583-Rhodomonas_salina.2